MWLAVLLILLGLVLLVAEVFIPSGGLLLLLAIVALVLGVVLVFFAPESEGGGVTSGVITVGILFVVIPLLLGVAFHYWPRTPMGKRMALQVPSEGGEDEGLEAYTEDEEIIGQIGQTVTPLRPAGITLIQGRRYDTKTEGIFVEAGQWVRVVDVGPGHVVVRPLDERELDQLPKPNDLTT